MAFSRNIPQATDLLQNSQGQILDNFNSSDDVFTIDHYAFSNVTANKGFHNKVTTPVISPATTPTTTTNPILYAMTTQGTGPETLQFSRGTSNAIPTPLTSIHSSDTPITLAGGASTNIINFTKFQGKCIASFYAISITAGATQFVQKIIGWNSVGSVAIEHTIDRSSFLNADFAGTTLRLFNNVPSPSITDIYWTLHLHRLSP